MDLNRGKIVEEWSPDGRTNVLQIAPANKDSQTTPEATFLAIGSKSIFTLDPRVKGNKSVSQKNYAKDPHMNCLASNKAGNIAIGCKTGEIKLISEVGKNAKTSLPGLGDPIISIDISSDERYLLATTETYLLVIQIDHEGKSGFRYPLGKNKKPPIKLSLDPRDILHYDIKSISFK